ncbi:hypothetical protein AABB24_039345 [Solanum stoloniferum]|uniref:Uncharacterized protein n=1 Tax=Solanum stoloniferum TaxID=62892 RepID=A0ABD2QQF4_9SOLN
MNLTYWNLEVYTFPYTDITIYSNNSLKLYKLVGVRSSLPFSKMPEGFAQQTYKVDRSLVEPLLPIRVGLTQKYCKKEWNHWRVVYFYSCSNLVTFICHVLLYEHQFN